MIFTQSNLSKGLRKSLQLHRVCAMAMSSKMNNRHAAAILIDGKIISNPVCNSDRTIFNAKPCCLGHAEANAMWSDPVIKKSLTCTSGGNWRFLPRSRKHREKG